MAHLVFQTAFPGDLFLSIPLLKRIKEWDSKTPLVLACRPGLGQFFLDFGLVDEVVEVDKKSRRGFKELRAREWNHVFVPHQSPRTALWMMRLKAKEKIGFRNRWNGLFFTKRVTRPLHLPDALRQLSLLTAADSRFAEMFGSEEVQALSNPHSQNSPFDFRTPYIPEWASMQVIAHKQEGKTVFLAPGSVWATKRWTADGYAELARLLIARGYDVELIGSPAERELCEQIKEQVNDVKVSAGKTTFTELVRKLSRGVALVCNDSGAMHAAAAADLPTVAVFGPTTLAIGYRPWQNKAFVVQRELKCRPCGKHGHDKCPIGTHECMVDINAQNVMKTVEQFLSL